jgi:hypothetical protein
MSDPERRIVQYQDLNLLGKAVFIGGAAARLAADLIDVAVDKAVDLAIETEKAFRHGLDPNVEDAKILEEHDARSWGNRGDS